MARTAKAAKPRPAAKPGPAAKPRPSTGGPAKESSSAYFARNRPRFLDWNPPTEDDLRREAEERVEQRAAELRKVVALEKVRAEEKKSARKKTVAR